MTLLKEIWEKTIHRQVIKKIIMRYLLFAKDQTLF